MRTRLVRTATAASIGRADSAGRCGWPAGKRWSKVNTPSSPSASARVGHVEGAGHRREEHRQAQTRRSWRSPGPAGRRRWPRPARPGRRERCGSRGGGWAPRPARAKASPGRLDQHPAGLDQPPAHHDAVRVEDVGQVGQARAPATRRSRPSPRLASASPSAAARVTCSPRTASASPPASSTTRPARPAMAASRPSRPRPLPDANRSQQPRRPHGHGGPCGSTTMWPISPAKPLVPSKTARR